MTRQEVVEIIKEEEWKRNMENAMNTVIDENAEFRERIERLTERIEDLQKQVDEMNGEKASAIGFQVDNNEEEYDD